MSLTGSCWGIKANMQEVADGTFRFTFPLMVTKVVAGSQAEKAGLQLFDHVVAYKRKNSEDFTSITMHEESNSATNFIAKDVQNFLMDGGNCELKIVSRYNNNLCKDCQLPVILHEEEGCLICHNCGVSVKTLCEYDYELSQYWNVPCKHQPEFDVKYTCKQSKISQFRNTPSSITKSRNEINRVCATLNLCESVGVRALDIFQEYHSSKQYLHKKIRRIRAVVVACMLIAGQQLKISVNFTDIVRFMMSQDSTFYMKRQEVRRIKLEICRCLQMQIPVFPVRQLCDMLCVALNLSISVAEEAQTMCDQIKHMNLASGHVSSSICAASVFFVACQKRNVISLKKLSEQSGVAELTIKKTFQDCVEPVLKIL